MRISDGRLIELIRGYLKQDVVSDLKRWTPVGGTPQGAVISPLLANLYLHPLDSLMRDERIPYDPLCRRLCRDVSECGRRPNRHLPRYGPGFRKTV